MVPVTIGKSKVLLIDTPGFDDSTRTDSEILSEIARLLTAQYQLGVQLKGVVYIHRITDIRYSRSAIKTFEIFKKVVGPDALKNVLLITSRWAEVDQATGSDRERQLKEKFWAYMIARGSNMSRFHGDRDSAVALASQLICKDTVILGLQKELVDQGKKLDETVAGFYVSDNLEKLEQQYEQELQALERLKQELVESDRQMKRQIQRDWEMEQARLRRAQEEQVSLQRPIAQEVHQEIAVAQKKRSGLSKLLPFIPSVVGILGMFVGIPPGASSLFSSFFSNLDLDFSSFGDVMGSL